MLPDSLLESVRDLTQGTMKLTLDRLNELAAYHPFQVISKKDPAFILFDLHPDSYTAPVVKEDGRACIQFSQLGPTRKQEIEQLLAMYNSRIYTLYAFAFMFTYEDKAMIVLWAQQLPVPPTFNRTQTNALLEEALGPQTEGSYFALSSVFHPAQLIEITFESEKISTAVGGHSFVMIIPVEKKWTLQLRKSRKKEPEDDFDILRRLLAAYKEDVVFLDRFIEKHQLVARAGTVN